MNPELLSVSNIANKRADSKFHPIMIMKRHLLKTKSHDIHRGFLLSTKPKLYKY